MGFGAPAVAIVTGVVLLLAAGGCTFVAPATPGEGRVACTGSEVCAESQVCVLQDDTGRGACFAATTPCLDGDDPARFVADGTPCGSDELICVAHACIAAVCGDGIVTAARGEECDDGAGNGDGADACRADCRLPSCGDGIVDGDEECDDGVDNGDAPNACRATCVAAACGDGIVDDAETCDNGGQNSDAQAGACRTSCVPSSCGDNVRDPGEGCDDGTLNSDVVAGACRTTCAPALCGDGVVDEEEECDDGDDNGDQPDACRATCVRASCGDGVIDADESCDNGAQNSDVRAGACRTTCASAGCGDGVLDPDEICDDSNVASGDGCRGDCAKVESCGDAVLDVGEACDDGNDNPRDGCADCRAQDWSFRLAVSGAVEPRAGVGTALAAPAGVDADALGRVLVVDTGQHRIRRVDVDGSITTIAGTGVRGFVGDGGAATSAALDAPRGIAVDPRGRLFIADTGNHRVRRVDPDGTITTIAGNGTRGFAGDGAPATNAELNEPGDIAIDASGQVLFVDRLNHCVRRVALDGAITTVAGTGVAGDSDDGGPAATARLNAPSGIAVDALGRVLVAEFARIRRVERDGTITTVAGTGVLGFSGDGGPARDATLSGPSDVAVDGSGRIVIADAGNRRVRRVDVDGTIVTVAGTGATSFVGDGGPATDAALSAPSGIVVDGAGRLVIADAGHHRIRRVATDGTIATIAGTGIGGFFGDGGPATSAVIGVGGDATPDAVTVDNLGRLLIADTANFGVRRVELDGAITTIAGSGAFGFSGDGGPATQATLGQPQGIATDVSGRVFIADRQNNRVRRVDVDGTITTVAGNGTRGFLGDGGPATSAALRDPRGVAVDTVGRLLIVDTGNNRVRRVELDGTIQTIAGTGESGFAGDGGAATSATLDGPVGIAVDSLGRILVADENNGRVRRIELNGTITSVAGNLAGDVADGIFATDARLFFPQGVAVDRLGRVLIAETAGQRIRRVESDGTITTIAGIFLESGLSGDGGPATNATLDDPRGLAVDTFGAVLVADSNNARIRRVELDGTITTVAGPVHPSGLGPVARARLYPTAALVAVDDASLFGVTGFGRGVRIHPTDGIDVVVGYDVPAPEGAIRARFAPLLEDARGVAFDVASSSLVVTERGAGRLRVIGVDPDDDGVIDDASAWTNAAVATDLVGPAGIVHDASNDDFIVVDEAAHCVRRIALREAGGALIAVPAADVVFGRCGIAGVFPGFLDGPTHVALSSNSSALYIADTGNHRVLRVDDDGVAAVVIGDGSVSSAGEGSPARLFPVNAPRQLALDRFGNLYVASTTTVRLVANVDGDNDADGDDVVSTIFGGGERTAFPESDAFCLQSLAFSADATVFAADACQGFLIELRPALAP
jgi:cysteine-rich repeat protein